MIVTNNDIQEFIKDIAKYLPSIIVPSIVGLITIPIITRLFQPSDYGKYVLVTSTISILSIIAIIWISSSITRFFPLYEQRNEINKFYNTILKLTLISIIIFGLLFVGSIHLTKSYLSHNLYILMHIGLILFILDSFLKVFIQILRAKRSVIWYSLFRIWQSVIGTFLGIILVIIFHFGIEGLLWGTSISIAIILPQLYKISIGNISIIKVKINTLMTYKIAKFGIPTIGINLLTWALSLSDRYLLGYFRDSTELGIYSASYGVAEGSIFLVTSLFLLPSAPIAYRIWEKSGLLASRDFVNKLTRYYILVCVPITVGLCIIAKPVVQILFAPDYVLGYKIIPLVASGALLVGFAHRFSLGFGYYKRSDLNMICFLCATLLNLILNFIFIPKFGFIAAAGTTLISYILMLFLSIVISRRFFIWKFPFTSLMRSVLASFGMGIVVYFISIYLDVPILVNLVICVLLGCVVYSVLLFILQEIQQKEKDILKDIIKGLLKRSK